MELLFPMFDKNTLFMFIRVPDMAMARKIADAIATPPKPATPPAPKPPKIANADMAMALDM